MSGSCCWWCHNIAIDGGTSCNSVGYVKVAQPSHCVHRMFLYFGSQFIHFGPQLRVVTEHMHDECCAVIKQSVFPTVLLFSKWAYDTPVRLSAFRDVRVYWWVCARCSRSLSHRLSVAAIRALEVVVTLCLLGLGAKSHSSWLALTVVGWRRLVLHWTASRCARRRTAVHVVIRWIRPVRVGGYWLVLPVTIRHLPLPRNTVCTLSSCAVLSP